MSEAEKMEIAQAYEKLLDPVLTCHHQISKQIYMTLQAEKKFDAIHLTALSFAISNMISSMVAGVCLTSAKGNADNANILARSMAVTIHDLTRAGIECIREGNAYDQEIVIVNAKGEEKPFDFREHLNGGEA